MIQICLLGSIASIASSIFSPTQRIPLPLIEPIPATNDDDEDDDEDDLSEESRFRQDWRSERLGLVLKWNAR
jgi:hypothetical protein